MYILTAAQFEVTADRVIHRLQQHAVREAGAAPAEEPRKKKLLCPNDTVDRLVGCVSDSAHGERFRRRLGTALVALCDSLDVRRHLRKQIGLTLPHRITSFVLVTTFRYKLHEK